MHDIYYCTALPPNRVPIPLVRPDDRSGEAYFRCDPSKIVAIVETEAPDRNLPFAPPDAAAAALAAHLPDFFHSEVARGRLPASLPPLRSGDCNIANAVLSGSVDVRFPDLTHSLTVIPDVTLNLPAP